MRKGRRNGMVCELVFDEATLRVGDRCKKQRSWSGEWEEATITGFTIKKGFTTIQFSDGTCCYEHDIGYTVKKMEVSNG